MPKRDLRIGVFVDAANIHACTYERYKKKVDYKKLLEIAVKEHNLYRAIVYAVKHPRRGPDGQEKSGIDSWITLLESFGFEVKTKEPVIYSDGKSKADWDIELCMDVVRMIDSIDIVMIISGDGDFIPLVRWCQSRGKIVRVIGVENSTNQELKKSVDSYDPINETMLMPIPDRARRNGTPKTQSPPASPSMRYKGDRRKLSKDLDITVEERQKLDQEIEEMEAKVDCPFQEHIEA